MKTIDLPCPTCGVQKGPCVVQDYMGMAKGKAARPHVARVWYAEGYNDAVAELKRQLGTVQDGVKAHPNTVAQVATIAVESVAGVLKGRIERARELHAFNDEGPDSGCVICGPAGTHVDGTPGGWPCGTILALEGSS